MLELGPLTTSIPCVLRYSYTCCVPQCIGKESDGIRLHEFPDPKKDYKRFRAWILAVGGDISRLDHTYVYMNLRVCNRHFKQDCQGPSHMLSEGAIPTLSLGARAVNCYKRKPKCKPVPSECSLLIPSPGTGARAVNCYKLKSKCKHVSTECSLLMPSLVTGARAANCYKRNPKYKPVPTECSLLMPSLETAVKMEPLDETCYNKDSSVTSIKVEMKNDILSEEQEFADDDVTHTNITDHLFTAQEDEVDIRSSAVKMEPLDDTDDNNDTAGTSIKVENEITEEQELADDDVTRTDITYHLFTDEVDIRSSAIEMEPFDDTDDNKDSDVSSIKFEMINDITEEQELADDDDTHTNITDHLFKADEDEIDIRSSDLKDFGSVENFQKKQTDKKKIVLNYCLQQTETFIKERNKLFECEICDKEFLSKGTLQRHIKIHTQEKIFQCGICNKTFIQDRSLSSHILRMHSEEKPLQCDICEKKFTDKFTLYRHIICHLGEKPFQCYICKKKYPRKSSLQRHFLIHWRKKYFSFK